MAEPAGHIRNPLSVIAIFAGIAEISGTIVLPFVSPEHQGTFIWFLMLFPAVLVVLFFLTLWFNHQSLYAPSDWKDETNFFRGKARPSTAEEITLKQEESIEDATAVDLETISADITENGDRRSNEVGSVPFSAPRSIDATRNRLSFARAEDLLMKKLESELEGKLSRNITFIENDSSQVVVDGVLDHEGVLTLIEALVFPNGQPSRSKINSSVTRFLNKFRSMFTGAANISSEPVVAIAGRGRPRWIHELSEPWNPRPIVKYYDLDELESQFGVAAQHS